MSSWNWNRVKTVQDYTNPNTHSEWLSVCLNFCYSDSDFSSIHPSPTHPPSPLSPPEDPKVFPVQPSHTVTAVCPYEGRVHAHGRDTSHLSFEVPFCVLTLKKVTKTRKAGRKETDFRSRKVKVAKNSIDSCKNSVFLETNWMFLWFLNIIYLRHFLLNVTDPVWSF